MKTWDIFISTQEECVARNGEFCPFIKMTSGVRGTCKVSKDEASGRAAADSPHTHVLQGIHGDDPQPARRVLPYLRAVLVSEMLLVFPVLLILHHGGNSVFYLLLLTSLLMMLCGFRPTGFSFGRFLQDHWRLHLAMNALLLAIVISDLALAQPSTRAYDGAARMALFPLILWGLYFLSPKQLRLSEWGYVAAALAGCISLWLATSGGASRPGNVNGAPIIAFANLTLLSGVLALISIRNNHTRQVLSTGCKIVAGGAGVYASYLSQSRGSWLALPALFVIVVLAYRPHWKMVAGALILIAMAAVLLSGSKHSLLTERLGAARSDIASYQNGADLDTSLGTRIQLWKGSWTLFREHPWFGIGAEDFKNGLAMLEARDDITATAANGYYHSHNDVLFHMTILGLPGLIAICAVYLVPLIFFLRRLADADREARVLACIGLAIVISYVIFGLTDCFLWGLSYTFYSASLAITCAQLMQKKSRRHPSSTTA